MKEPRSWQIIITVVHLFWWTSHWDNLQDLNKQIRSCQTLALTSILDKTMYEFTEIHQPITLELLHLVTYRGGFQWPFHVQQISLANDVQTNLEILISTQHISAVLMHFGTFFALLRLKIRVIFSGNPSLVFLRNLHI